MSESVFYFGHHDYMAPELLSLKQAIDSNWSSIATFIQNIKHTIKVGAITFVNSDPQIKEGMKPKYMAAFRPLDELKSPYWDNIAPSGGTARILLRKETGRNKNIQRGLFTLGLQDQMHVLTANDLIGRTVIIWVTEGQKNYIVTGDIRGSLGNLWHHNLVIRHNATGDLIAVQSSTPSSVYVGFEKGYNVEHMALDSL